MRNPNGHGSCYRLKGKRRNPWVARITEGWTEDKKQIRRIIGYFETKSAAMDALAMHRVDPVSPKTNLTLSDIYEEWSKGKYKNVSKATENNYRAAWKYINRYEKAKFKDLRTTHWQDIIDRCSAEG